MRKNPRTAHHSHGVERISKYFIHSIKYRISACGKKFSTVRVRSNITFSHGKTEQRLSRLVNTTRWRLDELADNSREYRKREFLFRRLFHRVKYFSSFINQRPFILISQSIPFYRSFPSRALFLIFRIGATRERDKRKNRPRKEMPRIASLPKHRNIDRKISRATVIDFSRSISPVNHPSFISCRTLWDELSGKCIARELGSLFIVLINTSDYVRKKEPISFTVRKREKLHCGK